MKASELKTIVSGCAADVRLAPKARSEWDKLQEGKDAQSVKKRTQLARFIAEFCRSEPHRLNDQQFKKEGNFSDGKGKKVPIWAFKPWQWRLYGAVLRVGGKKCFLGTEVDASKKQDKADKACLERAAASVSGYEEYQSDDDQKDPPDEQSNGKRGRSVGKGNRQRRKSDH